MVELLYRKCCDLEARLSVDSGKLQFGGARVPRANSFEISDPDKYVSSSPRFIQGYGPKHALPGHYSRILCFSVHPGTIDELKIEQQEGTIKRGPKRAFGITPERVDWFNSKVQKVRAYGLEDELPVVSQSPRINYLERPDGRIATFMAFGPQYLLERDNLGHLNLHRGSWIKTSLLWTIYRSELLTRQNMERLIEIDVPPAYMEQLESQAITRSDPTGEYPVKLQVDPDQRISGSRYAAGKSPFIPSGRTAHFYVRGSAMELFFEILSFNNARDITDTVKAVLDSKPLHPTAELYRALDLTPVPRELQAR